jgi:hypothetical protein
VSAIKHLLIRIFGKREVAADIAHWRQAYGRRSGMYIGLLFVCGRCGIERIMTDNAPVKHCGKIETQPTKEVAIFLPCRYLAAEPAQAATVIDTWETAMDVIDYESSSPEWI